MSAGIRSADTFSPRAGAASDSHPGDGSKGSLSASWGARGVNDIWGPRGVLERGGGRAKGCRGRFAGRWGRLFIQQWGRLCRDFVLRRRVRVGQ